MPPVSIGTTFGFGSIAANLFGVREPRLLSIGRWTMYTYRQALILARACPSDCATKFAFKHSSRNHTAVLQSLSRAGSFPPHTSSESADRSAPVASVYHAKSKTNSW